MTAPHPSRPPDRSAPVLGRHRELVDRVAVVTGAARGIGFGVARRLVAEGMVVVLADKDGPALDRAVEDLTVDHLGRLTVEARSESRGERVLGVHGDLRRIDAIDHLFETTLAVFGGVDLLVNNAADLQRRGVLDEHQALLDTQLATNVTAPYVCSQRAAAAMAAAGGGVIVNVSSVGGTRAHHDGLPYDVTKGAIDAMTRAMAVDLGPHGIRVNAVAPGVTVTHRSRLREDEPEGREVADRIPLRRFGTVDDIAAMVAFLASDDASYVTGQVLFVDGGITMQLSPKDPHAF